MSYISLQTFLFSVDLKITSLMVCEEHRCFYIATLKETSEQQYHTCDLQQTESSQVCLKAGTRAILFKNLRAMQAVITIAKVQAVMTLA